MSGIGKRAVVAATVALTAVTGAVVGTGEADAARLPNGSTQAVGIDGQVVKISRSGESSRIMRSMAANGAGRAGAVSGTYKVNLSKGAGVMTVGYLVGCQVNLQGFSGTLGGGISTAGVGASGSLSVPLAPGEVVFAPTDKMAVKKGTSTVMVDSFAIDVQQCGGHASARSVVTVVAAEGYKTDEKLLAGKSGYVQANLYGRPFSLG